MGMLSKWERKVLIDKLHNIHVDAKILRVVKYKAKKRLQRAIADIQLILAVFPDLHVVTPVTILKSMRGVGFEPTNPYGTGASVLRR